MNKPPVVLLGAGASAEAGVPTTRQMTERLVGEVQNDHQAQYDGSADALNYVVGASIAHATAQGVGVFESLDVEQLFSAVQLLAERRTLEVAPFVGSWRVEVERFDRQRWPSRLGSDLSKSLVQGDDNKVEDLLRTAIQSELGGGDGKVFRALLEYMTSALRRVVHIEKSEAVSYLHPIVLLARKSQLTVATLNYDRALEMACEANGVSCSTAIESWSESGRLACPTSDVYLLKLHGSIDWWIKTIHPGHSPNGSLPQTEVGFSSDPLEDRRPPAIVFGQRGKLRTEGPFLKILAEFEEALTKTRELVVVGYSFRDEHVNELIRRWLNSDMARHITVIDPSFPQGRRWAGDDFRMELNNNLLPLDQPTKMQPHFEPRMSIVREVASFRSAQSPRKIRVITLATLVDHDWTD